MTTKARVVFCISQAGGEACLGELLRVPGVEIVAAYASSSTAGLFGFLPSEKIKTCDIKTDASRLGGLLPDFLFSLQYKYRLNREVLDALGGRCFNLHFSLLPRYAGCYPLTWALRNGEPKTGVTLHHMTERFDDGDIVSQRETAIESDETAEELHARQWESARLLLRETLPGVLAGKAPRRKQDASQFFYHSQDSIDWRKDAFVDWSQPAMRVHNHIRAFTFPAYQLPMAQVAGLEVSVCESKVLDSGGVRTDAAVGGIAGWNNGGVVVRCGQGSVEIGKIDGLPAARFFHERALDPSRTAFQNAGDRTSAPRLPAYTF